MANVFIDLFNMSITASYLVLAVVVARLLLKKAPKWINCLLWALVGIRLICPFSFESSLSLIPGSQTISVNNSSSGRPFTVQSGVPVLDNNVNEFVSAHYYEGVTVPTNTFADTTTILAIVWLVGIFLMLLYGSVSYIRLHKRVGASLLLNDNIYYCDNIDTPFILGFLKPKIYVPSGISEEQIGYIALHEKAHLKRKDHFWKPLGFVLLSVYWFNPVIWVAYILLCRDIETACDEKVIKNMPNTEKKNYSETLVSCSVQRRMVMACPLAFGEVGVKQRIKSVLNYKKPAFWVILLALVLLTVVAVCFLTNPSDESSSIGIIGGADGPTSIIVSDKNEEKEIKKLQERYPHFFNLNIENGVTVYVTKLSQDNFECYLTSNLNPTDPQKVMHFDELASIDEMKLILSTYNLTNEEITVEPFRHLLSSYIGDSSEYDVINISSLLGLNLYNENTGDLKHIYGNYYYAIIDATSELQVYGLYYKDKSYPDDPLLVDRIGTVSPQFVVQDETLFYTSDGRLKSVDLNGDFEVTVYANGIYSSDKNYSIERIELVQDGKVYCKADRWGETAETQNDRETVYLAIKTDNSAYDEISKNDIPADKTQFDEILSNIKFTLNTDFENILVKNFRIRYTPTGNIEDAIFNVWVYNGTKANEDFWTEGNILITFDNTAFFNVINEEIVLLSEYNPKNDGSMQTIDEIINKAEISILQTKNIDKAETQPEYYLLTMDEEKYVEYVANADSGVAYLQEKNGKFVSSSKPYDLTPQTYQLLNKIYFIVVPHYQKDSVQSYVFEESENTVSGDYKVLLFDK